MNIRLLLFTVAIFFHTILNAQTINIPVDKIWVETPFEMPIIEVPNFENRPIYNIIDFGAIHNNKEKNSSAIQKAIAVASQNGGTVLIPPGEWLTKKIHLKSNINLHISKGATLLFSEDPQDYLPAVISSWEGLECYNYSPLIYAFDLKNVAITGHGTIKANNDIWKNWFPRPKSHMESIKNLYNWAQDEVPVYERNMVNDSSNLRPQFIQFNRCENVLIENIKIRNSPFWTIHLYLSKNIIVRKVDIYAHGHNNDGIDPEMSQNILIENCHFDQGDDAIAIKSGRNPEGWRLKTPSKNIVIRNCIMKNGHQLLAIGSELSGGIENILVENCEAGEGKKLMHLLFIKTNERMGGYVKNIHFKNIKAHTLQDGILGIDTDVLYQWRTLVKTKIKKTTPIENIYLENIHAKRGKFITKINGNKLSPANNISVKNVNIELTSEEEYQNKYVDNFHLNNSTQ